jgi:hypothetical protein
MLKTLVLVCAVLTAPLSGGISDYLKELNDKSGDHSMRNIDFIYTINLDKRPEKFSLCTQQLNPYGIFRQ